MSSARKVRKGFSNAKAPFRVRLLQAGISHQSTANRLFAEALPRFAECLPPPHYKSCRVSSTASSSVSILTLGRSCGDRPQETTTGSPLGNRTYRFEHLEGATQPMSLTRSTIVEPFSLTHLTILAQRLLKCGDTATARRAWLGHSSEFVESCVVKRSTDLGNPLQCDSSSRVHAMLDGTICDSGFARCN
jgi:hypothetical protein